MPVLLKFAIRPLNSVSLWQVYLNGVSNKKQGSKRGRERRWPPGLKILQLTVECGYLATLASDAPIDHKSVTKINRRNLKIPKKS